MKNNLVWTLSLGEIFVQWYLWCDLKHSHIRRILRFLTLFCARFICDIHFCRCGLNTVLGYLAFMPKSLCNHELCVVSLRPIFSCRRHFSYFLYMFLLPLWFSLEPPYLLQLCIYSGATHTRNYAYVTNILKIMIFTSRVCGRGNVFIVSVCLCVFLSVCLSVCSGYNFWTNWHRNFIFGMMVHLTHI